MIPGAQKFFHRQPTQYETALQKQVDELKQALIDIAKSHLEAQEAAHEAFGKLKTDIEGLRRQMLGYIKPEPEVVEEVVPAGFQTFTQRRASAAQLSNKAPQRKMAEKTKEVLQKEQANG